MAQILSFIVILFSCSVAVAEDLERKLPFLGSDVIDVQKYSIRFDIHDVGNSISVLARIHLKTKTRLTQFGLHMDSQRLDIQSVNGDTVRTFRMIKGVPGRHGLNGEVLKIFLNQEVLAGEDVIFSIGYQIRILDIYNELGVMYNSKYFGSKVLNIRSWPYYTRMWLPSNDHPSDVALFEYEFHIPRDFIAVANGVLEKGTYAKGEGLDENGLKVYRYSQQTPIPTYATNFFVSNFKIDSSMICYNLEQVTNLGSPCYYSSHRVPLNYFFPRNHDPAPFKASILKSSKALIFYSNLFHNYSFSNLSFVTAPHPFNMESVNLITLVSPYAAVHEVLHMWWGNSVYFKHWGDFWISEGLTTYFTGYYDEIMIGRNTACTSRRGILNHGPETDPLDIFNQVPYCKGAGTIEALRQVIVKLVGLEMRSEEGVRLFNYVMKNFYNQYLFRKIDSANLIRYFRLNLARLVKENQNIDLDQLKIDVAISRWKTEWFNLKVL